MRRRRSVRLSTCTLTGGAARRLTVHLLAEESAVQPVFRRACKQVCLAHHRQELQVYGGTDPREVDPRLRPVPPIERHMLGCVEDHSS
jgi:hypothetical protein